MRISVTKRSGVPVVDQIATQIILSIISGELHPQQRLPSIRALATRLRVHQNSVRAAYVSLEHRRWVELRQGSGAYIRETAAPFEHRSLAASFVNAARARGMNDAQIREAVERAMKPDRTDIVLVVEPEPELRRILVAELAASLPVRVDSASDPPAMDPGSGVLVVALAARAATIPVSEHVAPPLWLSANSARQLMDNHPAPAPNTLVTFVSHSPDLLRLAHAVLLAAGWNPESLLIKDARQPQWKRGLKACAFVIADIVAEREMPRGLDVKQLRIIADRSIEDALRQCQGVPM